MKIITGKVVSKKMQKTSSVVVERTSAHPIYKKRIKLTKKYHVHDETDSVVGDMVRFVEGKAFSKTKKWKVIEVVGRKNPVRSAEKTKEVTEVSKNVSVKKPTKKGKK